MIVSYGFLAFYFAVAVDQLIRWKRQTYFGNEVGGFVERAIIIEQVEVTGELLRNDIGTMAYYLGSFFHKS